MLRTEGDAELVQACCDGAFEHSADGHTFIYSRFNRGVSQGETAVTKLELNVHACRRRGGKEGWVNEWGGAYLIGVPCPPVVGGIASKRDRIPHRLVRLLHVDLEAQAVGSPHRGPELHLLPHG